MNESNRLYENKKGSQEKRFRNPYPRKRQNQCMKGFFSSAGVWQTRLDEGNTGNCLSCGVGKVTGQASGQVAGKMAGRMSIGGMELSQPFPHFVRLYQQTLSETMDSFV